MVSPVIKENHLIGTVAPGFAVMNSHLEELADNIADIFKCHKDFDKNRLIIVE